MSGWVVGHNSNYTLIGDNSDSTDCECLAIDDSLYTDLRLLSIAFAANIVFYNKRHNQAKRATKQHAATGDHVAHRIGDA